MRVLIAMFQVPAGMPEWKRTLITAAIGALVGVVSSILMEYLKPYIANRVLKQTVEKQIRDELMDNMSLLDDSKGMLMRARRKGKENYAGCLSVVLLYLTCLDNDRFNYYFTTAKSVLYRLDERHLLTDFYRILKQTYSPERPRAEYDFFSVQFGVTMAFERATEYCQDRGIKYVHRQKSLDAALDINKKFSYEETDEASPPVSDPSVDRD